MYMRPGQWESLIDPVLTDREAKAKAARYTFDSLTLDAFPRIGLDQA